MTLPWQFGATGPTAPAGAGGDPYAYLRAWEEMYGPRAARYELGMAEQNAFNNDLQLDNNAIRRQELRDRRDAAIAQARNESERNAIQREYQQGLIRIAEGELDVKRGGLEVQRGQLDVQRGGLDVERGRLGLSTLQLGSTLRGPRDWFAYQQAASGASQNPLLTNAVNAWGSLTNNRPTGLGQWGGGAPQPMTLNALASDFTGGPNANGQQGASPNGPAMTPEQQAFMTQADEAARNPHRLGAGWFESRNPDQQQMILGAWDSLGHSPDTVLARYRGTRIGQGIGGNRAA